jgi:hypothetical protein
MFNHTQNLINVQYLGLCSWGPTLYCSTRPVCFMVVWCAIHPARLTTEVVSSVPTCGEVYSKQLYVIKFVKT